MPTTASFMQAQADRKNAARPIDQRLKTGGSLENRSGMDRVAAGVDDAKVQRYRYVNQYACVADYEDNITAEVLPKQYSKRKNNGYNVVFR